MPEASSKRTRQLGILALAVIAPVWGYSWVVSKVALEYSEPFTFAALISALGALCLFAVLLSRGGRCVRRPSAGRRSSASCRPRCSTAWPPPR